MGEDDIPRHYGLDDLDWSDMGNGWKTATLRLHAGDTAFAPGKPKDLIYGPATVTYERSPSRAVTAIVEHDDDD